MTEFWTDATGFIFDATGIVVCAECPCEPVCDPDCWNYIDSSPMEYCEDNFEVEIPCQFTWTFSDPPDKICEGDEITLTGTFTNNSGDDIDITDLSIGATFGGATLTIISHTGTSSSGSGTSTIAVTSAPTVANGATETISVTFSVDSLGTPAEPGELSFGGIGLGYAESGHGANDNFGASHNYDYGCPS